MAKVSNKPLRRTQQQMVLRALGRWHSPPPPPPQPLLFVSCLIGAAQEVIW